MKKLFITACAVALSFAAVAQNQPVPPAPAPAPADQPVNTLKFEKTMYDFGQIVEGTQAKYDFKFTNTGSEPVTLSSVSASCGCTTPQWPRDPIAPGASSTITAVYNSTGRQGYFNKQIYVYTANAGTVTLTIQGTVVPPQEKPKSPVIVE